MCTSDHYPKCPRHHILLPLSYPEEIYQAHYLHSGPVRNTPPTQYIPICSILPLRTSSPSSPPMNTPNQQTRSYDHSAQASHRPTGAAASNIGARTTADRNTRSRHHPEGVMRIMQGGVLHPFRQRLHYLIPMPETNDDQVLHHEITTSTPATPSYRIRTRTVHLLWLTWRGSPKSVADEGGLSLTCSPVLGLGLAVSSFHDLTILGLRYHLHNRLSIYREFLGHLGVSTIISRARIVGGLFYESRARSDGPMQTWLAPGGTLSLTWNSRGRFQETKYVS